MSIERLKDKPLPLVWEHERMRSEPELLEKTRRLFDVRELRESSEFYLNQFFDYVLSLDEEELEKHTVFSKVDRPIPRILSLDLAKKDDRIREWFGEDILTFFSAKDEYFSDYEILELKKRPNLDHFTSLFSPQDVVDLLSKKRKIRIQVKHIVDSPNLAKLSQEMALARTTSIGWETSLSDMDIYLFAAGHQRVSRSTLYQMVEKAYSTDIGRLKTNGEKEKFIRSVLNTVKETKKMAELEYSLVSNGQGIDFEKGHAEWIDTINSLEVNKEEDERGPLSHLKPKMGIEIEHLSRFPLSEYVFMQDIGIGLGVGGPSKNLDYYEFAPGTFKSYKTPMMIFRKLFETGMIDIDREIGQSVHLDVGTEFRDGAHELLRFMQATGYWFLPEKNTTTSNKQNEPRIWMKTKGTPLIDIKEFTLQSPESFEKGLEPAFALSAGLYNFQKAMSLIYSQKISTYKRAEAYQDDDFMLLTSEDRLHISRDQVMKISNDLLSTEEKLLACLYLDFMKETRKVFRHLDCVEVLNQNCPRTEIEIFMKQIIEVLPDYWASYDVDPKRIKVNPFSLLDRNGVKKIYSNIVHYTRERAIDYVQDVEAVYRTGNARFLKVLKHVTTTEQSKAKYINAINYLFDNFPCGLQRHTPLIEKLKRYEELKAKYL